MKFILTVDTEADIQSSGEDPVTLENLASLPRFQKLCEKYGFKPTYLITYEVATESATASHLRSWQNVGMAEVGSHLHPWTTPPKGGQDHLLVRPNELPDDELSAKFETLTKIIEEKIGVKPTSYRAGRWGFDERQTTLLAKHGYLVDCSVTPKITWQREYGVDYRPLGSKPYKLSKENILEIDPKGEILEVPVTILYTGIYNNDEGRLGRWFAYLKDSLLRRVLNRLLFRQKWLRVFPNSTANDWKRLYISAERNNLDVLEFMIHSNELHLRSSSYSATHAAHEQMWKSLEGLMQFLSEKNVESVTLSEYARSYKK